MPLGMEVDLGPGDVVLDVNPASSSPRGGGGRAPNFRPMSIVAKLCGWINVALGM